MWVRFPLHRPRPLLPQDLWHEVMLLLVEEKDRAAHLEGSGLHGSGTFRRSGTRRGVAAAAGAALTPGQQDSGGAPPCLQAPVICLPEIAPPDVKLSTLCALPLSQGCW